MNLIPLGGIAFHNSDSRLAPHLIGGSLNQVLVIGPLFLMVGSLLVECQAVRVGAHYEIPASGFDWTSKDGTCYAVNETAFTGGDLVPSGNGQGTLIAQINNTDPFLTTAYIADEDA